MTKTHFCDLIQAALEIAPASEKPALEAMFRRHCRKVIVTADSGGTTPPPPPPTKK